MRGTNYPKYKDGALNLVRDINLYISSNSERNYPTCAIKFGSARTRHYVVVSIERYKWDDGIEIIALLQFPSFATYVQPHISITLTQLDLDHIARQCGVDVPPEPIMATIRDPRPA